MKFQQGDKVILVHSGEEGVVVDFLNKEMALVDVNGVRFPVYMDQMDFPYFKQFTEKKPASVQVKKTYVDQLKPEKKQAQQTSAFRLQPGVWLSFLPVYDKDVFDDDIVEYFRLYLVNQLPTTYSFTYLLKLAGNVDFELKNEIGPAADLYLHDLDFEKLNDAPRFDFEFSLKVPDKKKAPYLEAGLKLRAKQVFQRLEEIRLNQEAHFSFQLFETYPDKLEEESMDLSGLAQAGYRIYGEGKIHRQNLSHARSVVDLHIEKITDSWSHLSNKQILDLQLKEFEKFYELALLHHLDRMIVVHGIGKGRLREDLHDILRLKKEVKSFVNQYHGQFGFGATEIWFK
jgi:hypothetical protein